MLSVGWTYEDENGTLALAKQQGYQGAFTSFRENYLKITTNVNPATNVGLYERASWGVKNETNGSVTISTLGQRIVPEVLNAYFEGSQVSYPANASLVATNYTPFVVQPAGRFYVVSVSAPVLLRCALIIFVTQKRIVRIQSELDGESWIPSPRFCSGVHRRPLRPRRARSHCRSSSILAHQDLFVLRSSSSSLLHTPILLR